MFLFGVVDCSPSVLVPSSCYLFLPKISIRILFSCLQFFLLLFSLKHQNYTKYTNAKQTKYVHRIPFQLQLLSNIQADREPTLYQNICPQFNVCSHTRFVVASNSNIKNTLQFDWLMFYMLFLSSILLYSYFMAMCVRLMWLRAICSRNQCADNAWKQKIVINIESVSYAHNNPIFSSFDIQRDELTIQQFNYTCWYMPSTCFIISLVV